MSYMSSALARVIDSVLPGGGGRTRVPSKRGAGRTFSVTGNAQSGLSAAAATPDINASARTPMTFRMTPPHFQLFFGSRLAGVRSDRTTVSTCFHGVSDSQACRIGPFRGVRGPGRPDVQSWLCGIIDGADVGGDD